MSQISFNSYDDFSHILGLIGKPLSHSFSQDYFLKKFEAEALGDYYYDIFPLGCIHYLNILKRDITNLKGLNVTVPYKTSVIDFLDGLDETAKAVGAVNTIKVVDKKLIGYNTDVMGFERSLKTFLNNEKIDVSGALILGTGGASKAIKYVLEKMGFQTQLVSRSIKSDAIAYSAIDENVLETFPLIINTTPLGTFPKVTACPDIPYEKLTSKNALFDLVYNPDKTLFLTKGAAQNCAVKNGLEMLSAQAEYSWDIWTT